MERKDVKWEEIREKERELFNLEEQYYQQKKELDNKAFDLDERNANLEKLMSEEVDKMYQMMERNRIITEAKLAITAKNKLKDNFNKAAKKIATETKSTITSINNQMDTAIQGKVRKSLEEKIPNMLLKYDEI